MHISKVYLNWKIKDNVSGTCYSGFADLFDNRDWIWHLGYTVKIFHSFHKVNLKQCSEENLLKTREYLFFKK